MDGAASEPLDASEDMEESGLDMMMTKVVDTLAYLGKDRDTETARKIRGTVI